MSAEARGAVGTYGLMAEFDSPGQLIAACKAARQAGYRDLDAYTPYPIEAVWEALGHHTSRPAHARSPVSQGENPRRVTRVFETTAVGR